jgi:hypothetical protein
MTKFLHFQNPFPKSRNAALKRKYQSRTVAAEAPEAKVVSALAADFVATHPENQMLIHVLKVGVALVHPNDNYSKKTGRETAVSKMEEIPLKVVGTVVTPTHVFVRLQRFKGMALNLRLNKATGFTTVTGSISGHDDREDSRACVES